MTRRERFLELIDDMNEDYDGFGCCHSETGRMIVCGGVAGYNMLSIKPANDNEDFERAIRDIQYRAFGGPGEPVRREG